MMEKHNDKVNDSVQTNDVTPKRTVDDAWKYLENHTGQGTHDADSAELKAIRHKVDWRIVPLLFLCYTMQFLDKVLINVCLERHPIVSVNSNAHH